MSDEGVGVGCAGMLDEGASRVGWIGPVVFDLGVEVVWRAWAARAGKSGEWSRGLSEEMCSRFEDTVMIDGGDVGARGGFFLRQEKARSEENCGGLRTKDAAGGCHGFAGRVSRWAERCVAADLTIGL